MIAGLPSLGLTGGAGGSAGPSRTDATSTSDQSYRGSLGSGAGMRGFANNVSFGGAVSATQSAMNPPAGPASDWRSTIGIGALAVIGLVALFIAKRK
ncbi:MAG: hypothetical protein HY299_09860 [Verrucomicrobia bacterium]|nr:hypothetical protein [Verrucomicrobiota bacterium]